MQQPCMAFLQPQDEHQPPDTKSFLDIRNQPCPTSSVRYPLLEPWDRVPGSREGAQQDRQPFTVPRDGSKEPGEHACLRAGTSYTHHPACSPARLTSSLPFPQTSLSALQQTELQFEIQCLISLGEGKKKTDSGQRIHHCLNLPSLARALGNTALRSKPSPHSLPSAPERLPRPLCPPALTALSR